MRARDNPFSTDRILRVRYRPQGGLTWDGLLERLAELGWRASVVGPDGAGKTTLLEDLEVRLQGRGFRTAMVRLSETNYRISPETVRRLIAEANSRAIVLVDGADHLGRPAWWRFCRRTRNAGGLVITSHRRGLLPTLLECTTTPELLEEIVHEMLGVQAGAFSVDLRTLFAKHDGNVRDALRELYDVYAATVSK